MAYSVIIPSKNINNLRVCVQAIRDMQPGAEIIVIDDGLTDYIQGCAYIQGIKPFVFARNVNLGIAAAQRNDVVILNDDAVLKTRHGFTVLESACAFNQQYGLIAATTDVAGNPNQNFRSTVTIPHLFGVREDLRMVCFVCVYIPRVTIDAVGLLDERYVGYGLDDDDYCFSVRKAGLKIGICDGCFVNHSTLHSSYRYGKRADFSGNLKLFIEKWGTDNWGKTKEESEFRHLFPE